MKFEESHFIFHIIKSYREEPGPRIFSPPTNIYEREESWIIEVILPGVKRDSIKVQFQDNLLIIEAEREEMGLDVVCYHCMEWPFKEFRRIIELPRDIDFEDISTIYKDGVLKIEIPKKEKKRIEIIIKEEE
jgi:HSP20 family protein